MVIILIIFLIFFGYAIINWILNNQAPEEQIEAILIKKKISSSMDANNVIHTNYKLYFDINGNTKKFTVNHRIYKKYMENQKGILIYKRKRFVDFII